MQKLVLLKEENEWNCIFTASKQFSAKHCTNCYIRFTFYCFFTMNFANFSLFWATKLFFFGAEPSALRFNMMTCIICNHFETFFIKLHLTTFDWSKNFTGQLTSLPSVKSKHSILLTTGNPLSLDASINGRHVKRSERGSGAPFPVTYWPPRPPAPAPVRPVG